MAAKDPDYLGTAALDVPPQDVRRVDKAVRKEKNTFEQDWPKGRYLKLQSSYNPETFTLTFRLVPYRKFEALFRTIGKAI